MPLMKNVLKALIKLVLILLGQIAAALAAAVGIHKNIFESWVTKFIISNEETDIKIIQSRNVVY